MERAHLGLTNQTATAADPADLSPALAAFYFSPPLELDTQVRDYLACVRRLLAAPDAALTPQNPELQRILVTAPGRLLTSLGTAAAQYEREANQQIANLKFETGVLAVTLLTLLLEGLLIFYPLERDLARGRKSLVYNALHDSLTGLPNRAFLTDRLEQALLRRERQPEMSFAVLF